MTKKGAKAQWMSLKRAAEALMEPDQPPSVEKVKQLIRDGKLRFRKPSSMHEEGTVSREDVLALSGLGWSERENIPDTSELPAPPQRVAYYVRLLEWLASFPLPRRRK